MITVAFDIDGCLAEFNEAFRLRLQAVTGRELPSLPPAGPTDWHWHGEVDCTKAEWATAWDSLTPDWWSTLRWQRDMTGQAFKDLGLLLRQAEVTFVTARPKGSRAFTQTWLEDVLGPATVILTPSRKVQALIALEPDILIEDKGSTLADYAAAERDYALPPCQKILIARPYNAAWQEHLGLTVVETTAEAIGLALDEVIRQEGE